MSALQESLLDAMSTLADSAVIKSNATITLECKIIAAVDPALGLYNVEYLGNQFNVYSNPNIRYNVNDIVYVLVPDGDLDKTKTIIGSVTPSVSMYITDTHSENYVPISENLLWNMSSIELCSYTSSKQTINFSDVANFNIVFQDYLEKYNTYLFSAKIKTAIPLDQQQGGNYGIILNLPILKISDEDGQNTYKTWKTVSIDVNTIQGNPYRLNEYALQNIYFQMDEGEIYDTSGSENRLPYITAFVQDFAQGEDKPNDIFIRDINLQAIDVLTIEEKQGYSLKVIASEGNYFLSGRFDTKKTLTPYLKINGKDKNVKTYDCYWFVEDGSVTPISEDYSSLGGIGWKCLNEKTNEYYNDEGRLTYQYVTDIYELEIKREDVVASLRYKCVLVQNSVVVSGIIKIKNLDSKIEVELFSATGSADYVRDIGYVTLIGRIYHPGIQGGDIIGSFDTVWQRFDKSGNYLGDNFYEKVRVNDPVTETTINGQEKVWYETEIKFPCNTIDQFNTITCTFYSNIIEEEKIVNSILGTNTIMINTVNDFNYKIAIQNGDVVYKYDADGDSPKSADYDGPLTSVVKEIKPLGFRIFKNDGSELTETEYLYCTTTWKVPKNSMIKLSSKYSDLVEDNDYYYITGQGQIDVYYDILNTYNVKKNDNSILLTVNFNENILNEVANLKFLKDGESGTNGSKYTAIVLYDGHSYGERDADGDLCKLHCIAQSNYTINTDPETGEETKVPGQKEWGILNYKTGLFEKWAENWNPQFTIAVYCDGELVTTAEEIYPEPEPEPEEEDIEPIPESEDEEENEEEPEPRVNPNKYTISWSIFDSSALDTDFKMDREGHFIRKDNLKYNKDIATVVQAKIVVGNDGTTESTEVIYAYYPIELTFIDTQEEIYGSIIPTIIGGFDKVLYASDCTNPKYDSTTPFEYDDNLREATSQVIDYYTYKWESLGGQNVIDGKPNGNVNLIITGDDDKSTAKFRAITKFDSGVTNNGVKLTMTPVENINSLVNRKITELNNEIAELRAQEYFYDNIIDNLQELLKMYSYDNYLTRLDEIKDFLADRYTMINDVDQLQKALKDIVDYCTKQSIDAGDINPSNYATFNEYYTQLRIALYDLGKDDEIILPDVFPNLNNKIIQIADLETFKTKYPISIVEILQSLIKVYNDTLTDYNNIEADFIGRKEELKIFCKIQEDLIEIKDSDALTELTSPYENFSVIVQPLPDFVILKEQFNQCINLFWNVKEQCNNYDNINNRILKEFQKLFAKYSDEYYIIYYTNKRNLASAQIDTKIAQCDDYGKVIFEGFIGDTIIHIKPVILILNRYEMSNINGWDGSKLYIDDTSEDPQYLLAPQVGAGLKEEGTFTGVVMGIKKFNDKSSGSTVTKNHIGLFGFSGGQQTYFMNSRDGSVIMGKSGNGQIIIDPREGIDGGDKALLYSSNFWKDTAYGDDGKPKSYSKINENGQGMLIDLTTPEIRFGSGNFSVNADGYLVARGGGSIGGWKIDDTQIYSNVTPVDGRITLDSGLIINAKGYYIQVYQNQQPSEEPEEPKIATIYIEENKTSHALSFKFISINEDLHKEIKSITLLPKQEEEDPDQYKIIYKNTSSEDKILYTYTDLSNEHNFDHSSVVDFYTSQGPGKIYSHSHVTLKTSSDGFYLSSDGLSIGSKVYIDNKGVMKLGNGAVNGSSTYHWTVNVNSQHGSYIAYNADTFGGETSETRRGINSGNTVYLGTEGISAGESNFWVNQAGKMHSQVGDIGNWQIDENTLTSKVGNTILDSSNGKITCYELEAKTKGNIGGWSIEGTVLKGNNGTLTLDGNSGTITGLIENGTGFKLSPTGLTLNTTLGGALKFTPDTTKILNDNTEWGFNAYIDNLVVNNADIKKLLKYQGTETKWVARTVAVENGTIMKEGTATVGGVQGSCKVEIPNISSVSIIYLGAS